MPLRLRSREAHLTAVLLTLGACSSSEPRVPATLTLSPSTVSFTALDQTQQLSASVSDQAGNPLTEAGVSWSSSNGAVATVSSTGLVTATGAGNTQITAAAGSASAVAEVAVVQTPTQLTKVSGDGQRATAGEALGAPFVVEVTDALGNPVSGATVAFSISQGGGTISSTTATTASDGRASTTLTTGTVAGTPQVVSASLAATSVAVTFTAEATAGAPASIGLAAGNNQHAAAGTAVPVRPAVVVRDVNANPVPGVAVEFEIVSGGGSITGGSTVTNASGRAEVASWTLGTGANVLRATAALTGIAGNPVTFTASTAVTPFDIEVRFLSGATEAQLQAFTTAEEKWESMIVGDLPNVPINGGNCFEGVPVINETVDDLVIFATIEPIDGAGGILGQAGFCIHRVPGFLPLVGVMFFDSEDLEFVESEGLLEDLIVHEMGHVLGFGILWGAAHLNLLVGPASTGGTDPHFPGPLTITAFDDAGGTSYAGPKVPVENDGPTGAIDSHWRESVFDNELMTGFINLGANPLSAITAAALEDQGYTVDPSQADPFTLTAGLRVAGESKRLILRNDVLRLPLTGVDSNGRLTRTFRR